jgi:hypothetical protein
MGFPRSPSTVESVFAAQQMMLNCQWVANEYLPNVACQLPPARTLVREQPLVKPSTLLSAGLNLKFHTSSRHN